MNPVKPEISVIISTYDDRDLIPKKLAEISGQTYFDRAEFLFIEPDSPGKERELIAPFCEAHANCRLIALDERINLYQAWNLGWSEARAPLICISNMDDAMHPSLLEHVLLAFNKENCDVASVLIAKQFIDQEIDSWDIGRLMRLDTSLRCGPFFVWKKELAVDFGKFDERFEIGADKDFWARVTHKNLKIHLIPKVLYLYTKHSTQLSKLDESRKKKEFERNLSREKSYPYVWPVWLRRKIRICRILSRVPYWGRRYFCEVPTN